MPDDGLREDEPEDERDSVAPSIAGITWQSAWRNLALFVVTAVSIFDMQAPIGNPACCVLLTDFPPDVTEGVHPLTLG